MPQSKPMKNIAITTKHDLKKDKKVLRETMDYLMSRHKNIYLCQNAQANLLNKEKYQFQDFDFTQKVDVLGVIGGDGTVLRAVRNLKDLSTPILGINTGRLGFLVGISEQEAQEAYLKIRRQEYSSDWRMLLKIEIIRRSKVVNSLRALNEVVIGQSSLARMIELSVSIDNVQTANFRADGFIIATPTGSTAHSLSAGGPILHPKMEAFVLTPISPHSFNQKPIVITPEKVILVQPKGRNREHICLTIDGQISENLKKGDQIRISRYPEKIRFIRLLHENFFNTLKQKLKWGKNFK